MSLSICGKSEARKDWWEARFGNSLFLGQPTYISSRVGIQHLFNFERVVSKLDGLCKKDGPRGNVDIKFIYTIRTEYEICSSVDKTIGKNNVTYSSIISLLHHYTNKIKHRTSLSPNIIFQLWPFSIFSFIRNFYLTNKYKMIQQFTIPPTRNSKKMPNCLRIYGLRSSHNLVNPAPCIRRSRIISSAFEHYHFTMPSIKICTITGAKFKRALCPLYSQCLGNIFICARRKTASIQSQKIPPQRAVAVVEFLFYYFSRPVLLLFFCFSFCKIIIPQCQTTKR